MDSPFLHGPFWYDTSANMRLPHNGPAANLATHPDVLVNLTPYRLAMNSHASAPRTIPAAALGRNAAPTDTAALPMFGLGDPRRIEFELAKAQSAVDSLNADTDAEFDSYRFEDFQNNPGPDRRPAA